MAIADNYDVIESRAFPPSLLHESEYDLFHLYGCDCPCFWIQDSPSPAKKWNFVLDDVYFCLADAVAPAQMFGSAEFDWVYLGAGSSVLEGVGYAYGK